MRWGRRLITLPSYLMVAIVYLAASPLWAVCAVLLDLLRGKARAVPLLRALTFFALYLACELLGLVAAAVLWLATFGGRWGGERRYLDANAALQRAFSGALFFGSLRLFSVSLVVEGREAAARGPFLLFVRHSSTADTVLAAAVIANPRRLQLRYVIKRELLWDPCLDVVGNRLPNAFIERHSPSGNAVSAAISRLAYGLEERSAVLLYPEGTRFSEEKLAAVKLLLRQRGPAELASLAEGLRHVLPPRVGGALALLEAAPDVDVLLLEHTGFEGVDSFGRFFNGALVGRTLEVRLRRFAARSIPPASRARWLFERWSEMDEWIDSKRKKGAA